MALLRTEIPFLYTILKTLCDIIVTLASSGAILLVILFIVMMINRQNALGG